MTEAEALAYLKKLDVAKAMKSANNHIFSTHLIANVPATSKKTVFRNMRGEVATDDDIPVLRDAVAGMLTRAKGAPDPMALWSAGYRLLMGKQEAGAVGTSAFIVAKQYAGRTGVEVGGFHWTYGDPVRGASGPRSDRTPEATWLCVVIGVAEGKAFIKTAYPASQLAMQSMTSLPDA